MFSGVLPFPQLMGTGDGTLHGRDGTDRWEEGLMLAGPGREQDLGCRRGEWAASPGTFPIVEVKPLHPIPLQVLERVPL